MTLRDQVIQQALSLSPEDREYVADLLEQSLSARGFSSQKIADVWSREIDQRIAAYDRGETTTVTLEVALDNMHQALEDHRGGKVS